MTGANQIYCMLYGSRASARTAPTDCPTYLCLGTGHQPLCPHPRHWTREDTWPGPGGHVQVQPMRCCQGDHHHIRCHLLTRGLTIDFQPSGTNIYSQFTIFPLGYL